MSDLIDDAEPGMNAPEFTVSEISSVVKRMIEGEFSHVRVRGELGRVSRPVSGHIYLDLKDGKSVLNGVIWKGVASRLRVPPQEGMEVVATGRLTTFPGQSRYQMIIENLAPAGVGALMAMLEKRKATLRSEGLFDRARKKNIPYLPEVIGVVTSPSGAVIRDILHRLRDRFPRQVIIWPVAVQGEKSAPEVAAAINGFNRLQAGGVIPRPDLLIIARGGGSLEDLWGFNEEAVVRAAAASDIPLISAVGHETDTTLIDYASDHRAPTPTAAAELAVPVRAELMAMLSGLEERRLRAQQDRFIQKKQRLADLSRAIPKSGELVAFKEQLLDGLALRLPRALSSLTARHRLALTQAAAVVRPKSLLSLITQKSEALASMALRSNRAFQVQVQSRNERLYALSTGLKSNVIRRNFQQKLERLQHVNSSFSRVVNAQIGTWRQRLEGLERVRETLGYKATLKRGYAVVRNDEGAVVSEVKAAKTANALEIEFQDGRMVPGPGRVKSKPPGKRKGSPDQGSLF